MAILKSQTASFTDFDMNFLPHPVTGDIGRLKDVESIKRSVLNLLMTSHYERAFHPEIGGNIRNILFEPFGEFTENNLKLAIIEVLQNFEKRIKISGVDVKGYPDQNGFRVILAFYIENIADEITYETFLERVR
jgi:phage baseplate assembly protein W